MEKIHRKNWAGHHFEMTRETTFPRSNTRVDLMDDWERSELLHMIDYAKTHRRLHDPLFQLVSRGPVWDGDVISKSARDELLDVGACAKIYVKGESGMNAATYFGGYLLHVFDWLHGSIDSTSSDTPESPSHD